MIRVYIKGHGKKEKYNFDKLMHKQIQIFAYNARNGKH